MERRARFRTGVLLLLIFLLMSLFVFRLYKLQSAYDEQTLQELDSVTYQTIVNAARGQILDRNGTVLVSNRASYNLVIIRYAFFNGPDPNQSLLELMDLCDQLGIELVSHFPVSETRPYEFTLEDAGADWQSYFRKFLRNRDMDPDIAAGTLMNNLKDDYNIPGDLTEEEAYRLISIRFELELRGISDMPLDNYVIAEDVSAEDLATIIELGIPGIIVQTTTVREYHTDYAAHLLGTTGAMWADEYESKYKDMGYPLNAVVGKDGIELAFEEYLHGQDGVMETTITSTGEILDQHYITTPVPGNNVELSIDIDLQMTAFNALEQVILDLRENGVGRNAEGKDAKGGAVVVQEVDTGEILAAVSYPTFNLETYHQDYKALEADTEYTPLINRALNAQYPPGSIYKMVTAITAIDYSGIGRYLEVTDLGRYLKYQDQGYTPACHIWTSTGGGTHGTINMMEALRDSCNYYFYEVGLQVATEDVDYVAGKLGLGESTGAELIEWTGTRANAETKAQAFAGSGNEEWVEGDKLQAAIGQSLNQFTPLQMCVYTSTLANEGTRLKATFLRRVVSWDFQELILENSPQVLDTLELSEEALKCIQEGMVLAASIDGNSTGTAATYLWDYPIQVAAKTGTAQHGTGEESDNASFVCYAPADDPQIAISIYVENGSQGGNLGQIARAIMDVYFSQESKYETVGQENIVY